MLRTSLAVITLFGIQMNEAQTIVPVEATCGTPGRAMCKIWGDPHTCSWDGAEHHFQGRQWFDAGQTIRQGWYYIDGENEHTNTDTTGGLPFDLIGFHYPCGTSGYICLEYLLFRVYDAGTLSVSVALGPDETRVVTLPAGSEPPYTSTQTITKGITLAGVGGWIRSPPVVDGVVILQVQWWQPGSPTTPISSDTKYTGSNSCPNGCENWQLIVEIEKSETSLAHTAHIWMSPTAFVGDTYGLCGTNDGTPSNDFPARGVQGAGRRLLQTDITFVDGTNMQSWTNIKASRAGTSDDAWEKTKAFGDTWAVFNPGFVDPNDLPELPSDECIDTATAYCTSLWYDETVTDCHQCDTFPRFNTNFEGWLQGCILDTCVAANDDGVNLEDISLNQALNAGYFVMAIDDCTASCRTVPGDCSDWTSWMDRDDPSQVGDWERIIDFELDGGSICDGGRPSGIECRSVNGGVDYADFEFDENIETRYCVADTGFLCVNGAGSCPDFEVRFCCGEYVRDTSPYFECPDICTDLTNQNGCAGDQCLETCRNCITGIDWWDYQGGQNTNCQCHNNGCNLCPIGWFKVDYDFPCQPCSAMEGCSHCTDFSGCQQCEQGYTMVEDDDCGEESHFNTNNQKVKYCVPI